MRHLSQPYRFMGARITTVLLIFFTAFYTQTLANSFSVQISKITKETEDISSVESISRLKSQGKYLECAKQAQTVDRDSRLFKFVEPLLNECLFQAAQQDAKAGNFSDAIVKAAKISYNSQFYLLSQQLMYQWSQEIPGNWWLCSVNGVPALIDIAPAGYQEKSAPILQSNACLDAATECSCQKLISTQN